MGKPLKVSVSQSHPMFDRYYYQKVTRSADWHDFGVQMLENHRQRMSEFELKMSGVCVVERTPILYTYFAINKGKGVVGAMLYRHVGSVVDILGIRTRPDVRRRGIGTSLLTTLTEKTLAKEPETYSVVMTVRDSLLAEHLFLRNAGFSAVSVVRDAFDTPSADGYVFEKTIRTLP